MIIYVLRTSPSNESFCIDFGYVTKFNDLFLVAKQYVQVMYCLDDSAGSIETIVHNEEQKAITVSYFINGDQFRLGDRMEQKFYISAIKPFDPNFCQ